MKSGFRPGELVALNFEGNISVIRSRGPFKKTFSSKDTALVLSEYLDDAGLISEIVYIKILLDTTICYVPSQILKKVNA